jgi:hypothetical protein
MRALEVREKKAGVAGAVFDGGKPEFERGLLFMNTGRSGQSLASIEAALDAEFDRRFRAALWLLGYVG